MALYARNINWALGLTYTPFLSVYTWSGCVCTLEGDKRAQRKLQCNFKTKISKEIFILDVYDKWVPQSPSRCSEVFCEVGTIIWGLCSKGDRWTQFTKLQAFTVMMFSCQQGVYTPTVSSILRVWFTLHGCIFWMKIGSPLDDPSRAIRLLCWMHNNPGTVSPTSAVEAAYNSKLSFVMTRMRVSVLLHLSVDLHIRIVQETIKKIACVAREGVGRLDWKDPVCTLILVAYCLTLCNPRQVGILYSDPQDWSIVFLPCPHGTGIHPSCSPLEQTEPAEGCIWSPHASHDCKPCLGAQPCGWLG